MTLHVWGNFMDHFLFFTVASLNFGLWTFHKGEFSGAQCLILFGVEK